MNLNGVIYKKLAKKTTKNDDKLKCSGRLRSSCSTSDTRQMSVSSFYCVMMWFTNALPMDWRCINLTSLKLKDFYL